MKNEPLIDVLDENGIRTGEVLSRREIHEMGKYHRAVHLYLIDESKRLLLQKRSRYVDHFPEMFSISLSGHVDTGENSYSALKREIQEELGFFPEELKIEFLFSFKQSETINPFYIDRQFNDIYICFHRFDVKKINFDKNAITELKLVTLDEFANLIAQEKTDFSKIYAKEGHEVLYFIKNRKK